MNLFIQIIGFILEDDKFLRISPEWWAIIISIISLGVSNWTLYTYYDNKKRIDKENRIKEIKEKINEYKSLLKLANGNLDQCFVVGNKPQNIIDFESNLKVVDQKIYSELVKLKDTIDPKKNKLTKATEIINMLKAKIKELESQLETV